jgi:hypothetical protein
MEPVVLNQLYSHSQQLLMFVLPGWQWKERELFCIRSIFLVIVSLDDKYYSNKFIVI